ncbi:hypothetical protein BJ165DRAFT_1594791 [Panaeolus papilionaceus]|nr:hypothetical protein BJ165DRAFT_1594791 [Panaeolus papilionaceus]
MGLNLVNRPVLTLEWRERSSGDEVKWIPQITREMRMTKVKEGVCLWVGVTGESQSQIKSKNKREFIISNYLTSDSELNSRDYYDPWALDDTNNPNEWSSLSSDGDDEHVKLCVPWIHEQTYQSIVGQSPLGLIFPGQLTEVLEVLVSPSLDHLVSPSRYFYVRSYTLLCPIAVPELFEDGVAQGHNRWIWDSAFDCSEFTGMFIGNLLQSFFIPRKSALARLNLQGQTSAMYMWQLNIRALHNQLRPKGQNPHGNEGENG